MFATGNAARVDEWWLVPSVGGKATSTNTSSVLAAQGLLRAVPQAWPDDGSVVFTAHTLDHANRNLWQLSIRASTFQASGPAQRLTFGTGDEAHASSSRAGQFVFSSLTETFKIWGLPAAADSGKKTGDLELLTQGLAADGYPMDIVRRQGHRLRPQPIRKEPVRIAVERHLP